MNILIADALSDGWQDALAGDGIQVNANPGLSSDELLSVIGKYDGLIVRSATQVTRDLISAGTSLRAIGRAGAGVDNIDIDAATERGIVVLNAPGGNTISTAEHTVAMMLALSRNIPQATASIRSGKWDRRSYTGVELEGKVLGIIGVGRVGLQVAHRARAFGMRVIAFDPVFSSEMAEQNQIQLASNDEIFAASDYITLHAPLIKETRHVIDDDAIARCKDGVRILNCARGGLVEDAALLRGIESGKVAGAALDVFEVEPPPPDYPLAMREEVICTPHLGASTHEAQEKVARQIAVSVLDALKGNPVQGAINLPAVDPEMFDAIQPYMVLGDRVGALIAQLSDGSLKKMTIDYQGEVLEHATSPMTAAVLKGAVSGLSNEPVTYVNAPIFARKRGVQIEERRSTNQPDYVNLITVQAETSTETTTVTATVFGKRDPRLIRIDAYEVKAKLEGHLLICCNKDEPGVVGWMGTLLAKQNINIADMALGRESRGGDAIMVFNIDEPVTSEVLEKIESDPLVLWAKQVEL